MKETVWTPASIAVGERADNLLVLVLGEPIEITSIPMSRQDAHLIGAELMKAAALTPDELDALEETRREGILQ